MLGKTFCLSKLHPQTRTQYPAIRSEHRPIPWKKCAIYPKIFTPTSSTSMDWAISCGGLVRQGGKGVPMFCFSDIQLPEDQMVSKELKIPLSHHPGVYFQLYQACSCDLHPYYMGQMIQDRFHLMVQDNGRGFDAELLHNKAATSFGLLNMQERARILSGIFKIESTSRHGTKNQIIVPI